MVFYAQSTSAVISGQGCLRAMLHIPPVIYLQYMVYDQLLWETRDHDITSCNWTRNVGSKLALFSSDSDTRRRQPMKMSYGIIKGNVWERNQLGHGAWGSLNWLTQWCPEPTFLHYTAITVKCWNSTGLFVHCGRKKKKGAYADWFFHS